MGRVAFRAWLAVPLIAVLGGPLAHAQEKEAQPPGAEAPAAEPPAAEPPAATPPEQPTGEAPREGEVVTPSEQAGPPTQAWTDIFVVPRRTVLKRHRVEFMPTYNVTLNSSMIRHHGFGGELNFYLSESLFIGAEGTWYQHQITDRYFLIGVDQRVLPSVNEYRWSAFLDFGYVFASGKFTLFNNAIVHWDTYVSGGVGVFGTEVLPKNPADNGFSSIRIAGLLPGIGTHMWLNRWFALDAYFKDYIFADQLEPNTRMPGDCVDPKNGNCAAQKNAQSQFTFNMVFGVGFSIMLPPGFEYRTPR